MIFTEIQVENLCEKIVSAIGRHEAKMVRMMHCALIIERSESRSLREQIERLETKIAKRDSEQCWTCAFWDGAVGIGLCWRTSTITYKNEFCSKWKHEEVEIND